jgi:Tol biopolymer transport system component
LAAVWQKGVTGDAKESLLVKEDRPLIPSDWSKNNEYIVYWGSNDKTGDDIKIMPVSGDRTARAYLATQFDEQWGKVSPDGKWMSYQSNDSGRFDIYVQSFPVPGGKVKVSRSGGSHPSWGKDGRELYYVSADDKLMAVPVQSGAEISAGTPVALFEIGSYGRRNNVYTYQPAVDGQRFLVIKALDNPSTRPLTLLQNLTSLFDKSSN